MNKNVNVFIAVVLCALLCGGFVWLRTADDEKLGWNIHDSYAEGSTFLEGASYTNTSSAGSSSAGSLSIPQVSSSRSLRRSTVSSYAGAHGVSYGVAPTSSPNSSVTSSPMSSDGGLYATSSQTFKSFGSGNGGTAVGSGNGGAAVGGGMRGGATMSNSLSPITYVSSGVGSSTSLPFREGSGLGMSGDGSYAAAPARSSSLFGAYGDIYASTTVGSYNPMSSVYGGYGYAGVRGRMNSGNEPTVEETWLNWLAMNGHTFGHNDGDTWYFDETALRKAWEAFCASWNETMGKKPTWEEWLAWFRPSGEGDGYEWDDGTKYSFLPVGDVLPLFLLALMYIAFILSKSLKSVNENK